jgi:hypothetical protein
MQRARDVGRAVLELGARVAEVDLLLLDRRAVAALRPVVDDGAVLAGARDGGEGEALEEGLLAVRWAGLVCGRKETKSTHDRSSSSLSAPSTSSSFTPFPSCSSSHAK